MPSAQDVLDKLTEVQTDANDLLARHTDSVAKLAAALQAQADATTAQQTEAASSQHLGVDLAALHQLIDSTFAPNVVVQTQTQTP